MARTRQSAAFYSVLAISLLVVALALIRYFYPNATGPLWDTLVYLTLALAIGVLVFWLLQIFRSRNE